MKIPLLILMLFSFRVGAQDLRALSVTDPAEAMLLAQRYESSVRLRGVIFDIYTLSGGDPQWAFVYKVFKGMTVSEKLNAYKQFGDFIGHVRSAAYAQRGIRALAYLNNVPVLSLVKANRLLLGDTASAAVADSAINSIEAVNSTIYSK